MNPDVTIEPHYNTLFHFPSCVQSSCNDPKKLRTETLRQWWHDRSWFQATPMSDCIIDPGFKPHQCLIAGTVKRMAQLPCWLPRGQQVLH